MTSDVRLKMLPRKNNNSFFNVMFDDTEAAHLSEMYDDAPNEREPRYSAAEKKDYLSAKNCRFRHEDIGKYCIVQNPRRNKRLMQILFLVDRTRIKWCWWSPDSALAMIFTKKEAADAQAKKYKYNKARVICITEAMCARDYFALVYGE